MGQKRQINMDLSIEDEKPSKSTSSGSKKADPKNIKAKKTKKQKSRSRRYRLIRTKIDATKTYPLSKALKIILKISNTKFISSIEVNVNLSEANQKFEVSFPHPTGKSKRVAIATEKLLNQIEKGKFDFDILVASPEIMPRLAKLARVLGPRGLMPNPKDNTISSDPEKTKAELESGKTMLKAEKKAPLLHTVIGKTNQPQKQLEKNLLELIKVIGIQNIKKLSISSSMSPGIKIDLSLL